MAGTAAQLKTEVEARYSTQLLVELSNPDDEATTSSSAKILKACTDVIAAFRTSACLVWLETDEQHVEEAVEGVIYRLRSFSARASDMKAWRDWREGLEALRLVTFSNRVAPTTDADTARPGLPSGAGPDLGRAFSHNLVPGSHPTERSSHPFRDRLGD